METFHLKAPHDGQELFARHWPAQNSHAVMTLIHGFGEHCGRYDHMAAHLTKNGVAVLSMDLRGHGKTEGKRGGVDSFSELISDVGLLIDKARKLYPNSAQYLFGHSMGGGIVLQYGLTQSTPLDGYLVSAPLLRPAKSVSNMTRSIVRLIRRLHPNFAISNKIDGRKISTLMSEQKAYEADPFNHGVLGVSLAVGMVQAGEDSLARAQDWDHPLLLWHAKNDQLTNFQATEKFASEAKNCRFTAFEDVEHEMHNDTSRDQVYAMMVKFMSQESV